MFYYDFIGVIIMVIKDSNGNVVGLIEFSKEEMERFTNEEMFKNYAKLCLETATKIHEQTKQSEIKINEQNKQSEFKLSELNKQSELKLNEQNKQSEERIAEEKMKSEERIVEGKRKSEDVIRIIAAVVDTVKYGINEFTGLYERFHEPKNKNMVVKEQ